MRAYLGGELVADSIHPLLVWESLAHSPSRGDGRTFTVSAGGKQAPAGAVAYEDSPIEQLRELIRLEWGAMDAWFEEDEEVYTHARNPYTRIDILASSRHLRVVIDGTTVAESPSPRLLFETGVVTRYYLPKTHVRMDLLEPTDLVTHCPYKGQAQSWSARLGGDLHEEIAWSYPAPLPESQKIAGLIAFYNEKVDLFLDGVQQPRSL